MNHSVTIRADRPEITDRINMVIWAHGRKRGQVMHMYETGHFGTVSRGKIDLANVANRSMMSNASCTRARISFVAIHQNLLSHSFAVRN